MSTCLSVSISVLCLPAAPADDDHYFPGTLQEEEEGEAYCAQLCAFSTQPNPITEPLDGSCLSPAVAHHLLLCVCVCYLLVVVVRIVFPFPAALFDLSLHSSL